MRARWTYLVPIALLLGFISWGVFAAGIPKGGGGGGGGGLADVVDDTSPQAGGDLDMNGSALTDATDGVIDVTGTNAAFDMYDGATKVLRILADDLVTDLAYIDAQAGALQLAGGSGIRVDDDGDNVVEYCLDGAGTDEMGVDADCDGTADWVLSATKLSIPAISGTPYITSDLGGFGDVDLSGNGVNLDPDGDDFFEWAFEHNKLKFAQNQTFTIVPANTSWFPSLNFNATTDEFEIDSGTEEWSWNLDGSMDYTDSAVKKWEVMADGRHTWHGSMYGGHTTTVSVQDTWYETNPTTSGGVLNGVSFATGDLTIDNAGVYQVKYSASFSGGASDVYEVSISIDDVIQAPCTQSRKLGTGGDTGNMGGTCILSLAAAEVIKLEVRDLAAATDDAVFSFVSVTVSQL